MEEIRGTFSGAGFGGVNGRLNRAGKYPDYSSDKGYTLIPVGRPCQNE